MGVRWGVSFGRGFDCAGSGMNPIWIVLGIVAAVLALGIWALWDLAMIWRWAIGTMFGS